MKNVAFDRAVLSGSRVVEMEQGRFVSTRYFHSLFAELFYFTTLRDLLFFGTSSQTSCRMRRMELADGRCRSADTIHLRAKISSRLVVASEVRDVDRASHFRDSISSPRLFIASYVKIRRACLRVRGSYLPSSHHRHHHSST